MKKKNVLLLTFILVISTFTIIFPIQRINAELCQKTVKLYPTDDTYVDHGGTDENLGSTEKIVIRNDYGYAGSSGWGWDALIKFDISSIIQGTTIVSAKLNIYYYEQLYYNHSNNILTLYRVTSDWDENTVTWDNQPYYASQKTSIANVPSTINLWIEFNVTNDVKGYATGLYTNYGWKITDENLWEHFDIPEFVFKTKESNNINYWPYLEIELLKERPKADFNYNVSVYEKKVDFTDNSTDENGAITSYYWDFGDSFYSTLQNPSHTYTKCGIYSVNLTITDNIGITNYSRKNVSIPIEQIVKKEIEKLYNITLTQDFYINELNEFFDPNNILYALRTIQNNDYTSYLIAVNNSIDNLFIWNTTQENITKVKHDIANITSITNDSYNYSFIVNITANNTNYTYIKVNDYYANISGLTVVRSDGSTVSEEYIWRENNTVYFFDNLSSEYQLIYYNNSNENIELPEVTTSDNNNFILGLILISFTIISIFICLFQLSYKKRKVLSYYIKKGNAKINEIDYFIEKIERK